MRFILLSQRRFALFFKDLIGYTQNGMNEVTWIRRGYIGLNALCMCVLCIRHRDNEKIFIRFCGFERLKNFIKMICNLYCLNQKGLLTFVCTFYIRLYLMGNLHMLKHYNFMPIKAYMRSFIFRWTWTFFALSRKRRCYAFRWR